MNSDMIAVFIEPHGSLLASLRERKAWLESRMPKQAYCNHPPHCTLLVGKYGSPRDWLGTLRRRLEDVPAFELETVAWQQFPQDDLAGGGHTIAYRVQLTPALAFLQEAVADSLGPFATQESNAHPLSGTEPFASSLRKFGFPFVGGHWIPHFTIGSPLVAPESALLTVLMAGPVQHHFVVRSVSVWRVDGDYHERLHELALSPLQI